MLNHTLKALWTKETTISRASTGLSIGTRCPALFTILNSRSPALFIAPTTLLLIFQGVNRAFLKASAYLK